MANQCRKRATHNLSAKAESLADQLIARAKDRGEKLDPAIRAELEKILAHNDQAARPHRVSGDAAIELLRTNGKPMCRSAFDALIQREFGRRWGGK